MSNKLSLALLAAAITSCSLSCTPPTPSSSSRLAVGDFKDMAAAITNSPSPVHVGDKVVFDYALKNTSSNVIPGRSYFLDLYVDRHVVSFDHGTSDILPGETTFYGRERGSFDWQPTNAGRHEVQLVVVRGIQTNSTKGELDVLP